MKYLLTAGGWFTLRDGWDGYHQSLIWLAKAMFLCIKIKSINQNIKVIQRVNIVGIVRSHFFELIVPLVATHYTILNEFAFIIADLYCSRAFLSFFHKGVIKNMC